MLQEIARVFSSNGVLLQGSEPVPLPGRPGASAPDRQGPGSGDPAPRFDQASAKLDLSKQGQERMASGKTGADGKPLTPEQEKQVRELEKRDREVKAHEAAHQAAAGGQARGGAAFEYQAGPDGKNYAVGGHVDIEVSPVQGNPRATLERARTAQRAALAPSDPSGQDRAVAAAAAQMAAQAQAEIAQGKGSQGGPGSDGKIGTGGDAKSGSGADAKGGPGANTESGAYGGNGFRAADAARMRSYGRRTAAAPSLSVYA